jgi:Protein of unknown function (DUF2878)
MIQLANLIDIGPSRSFRLTVNFIAFQIGWFACVLGAAHDRAWIGTLTTVLVVSLHLLTAVRPSAEARLVMAAIVVGAVLDSVLLSTGWIRLQGGLMFNAIAPHWILALWALFATTLNVSLRWLHGRWLVALLIGAIAGPLSYWGGVRMGAAEFVQLPHAIVGLAVEWAIATPLLMWFALRFDGMQEGKKSA